MASSTSMLSQQNRLLQLPAIAKLARWRFKQMWRFLAIAWLGMLAMVVLVCAGPLFSRVATSAYTRSLIASAPDGTYITVDAISTHPTQEQLQQIEQQSNQSVQKGILGSYLPVAPQVIVQTPPFDMFAVGKTTPAAFDLAGYESTQATRHANIVQGRLPRVTTDGTVEIALSQEAASGLGLHVGSTIQGRFPIAVGSQAWNFRVVGIIAPKIAHDTFWAMADPFSRTSIALASRYYFVNEGSPSYNVVAASDAIEPKIAVLQTLSSGGASFTNNFVFFLRYPFDLAHLDANDLPALSQQTTDLDNQFVNRLQRNTPDLAYANIFGTLFTSLEFSSALNTIGQVTVTFLLLITLALVLFLVSMISDVLVERQAAAIATLRSRGATHWHIFGTFIVQGLVLGVAALLAGPLLAILLVRAMAQALLTPNNQSAINVITAHPIQTVLDVKWDAIIAVGVAVFVLILATRRATKTDIVSFRRESARPQRVPFWRRFYLDLFIVILLLAGYAT
jgi:ABC-type lipoprotein release transport system permease subunit